MSPIFQKSSANDVPHGYTLRPFACLAVFLGLSGCATNALDRAPVAHDQPWRAPVISEPVPASGLSPLSDRAEQGFVVPANRELSVLPEGVQINPDTPLGLTDLIDIAQRENPETRQAWNRAREAALAVGMVEATFLPMLSANVIGGHQRTRMPSPLVIDGRDSIETDVSGVVPALVLEWLIFDFGKRAALLEGAEQVSLAANILFNATHQKVIRDVTEQFYQYNTAYIRKQLAEQALSNHQKVAQAVRERMEGGVATSVELAVARQAVAQGRLRLVNSEGVRRNAYLGLLSAVGLPPTSRITIAMPPERRLPEPSDPMTDTALRQALTRRADIAASYAAMKAAQAGVKAAEAEFMPKVYLGAVAARNRANFGIRGLPELSQQATSRGVLLGVTVPLFDGGLRRARLGQEEINVQQARDALHHRQRDALREIVGAETLLRSSLESHQAASELVQTASIVYDAALESYKEGVGTITLATEAATGLLDARQAQTDAYGASLLAAANLAFLLGNMTSAQDNWLAPDS